MQIVTLGIRDWYGFLTTNHHVPVIFPVDCRENVELYQLLPGMGDRLVVVTNTENAAAGWRVENMGADFYDGSEALVNRRAWQPMNSVFKPHEMQVRRMMVFHDVSTFILSAGKFDVIWDVITQVK